MADDKVSFELVTPERLLLSQEADMVVVPGGAGDFGVLPRHAPLISTVRPGTIRLHDGGGEPAEIFVASGFAEVTPERCTVLAEEAVLSPVRRASLLRRRRGGRCPAPSFFPTFCRPDWTSRSAARPQDVARRKSAPTMPAPATGSGAFCTRRD